MSYKPVSLTNIHCKLFERITNKRLFTTWRREKKGDRKNDFGIHIRKLDAILKITKKSLMGLEERINSSNLL